MVPIGTLDVISHQRKLSEPHLKRLVESVGRVGFLAPLIVVERDDHDGYLVIDGQHRLLAAKGSACAESRSSSRRGRLLGAC